MIAISAVPAGSRGDRQQIRATIIANETPQTLPTTGADVTGMTADQVFAPMSVLFVTAANASTKMYIANEQGEFVAQ